MSLIRQVWLLLVLTLTLAFAGALGVTAHASRQYLDTQLALKNHDTAQALALMLSQQQADPVAMQLVLTSQFDTGFYESIRLEAADGTVMMERHAPPRATRAPAWFVKLLDISPAPGVAAVNDKWKRVGRLQVVSHAGYAYDQLWQSSVQTIALLALVALCAGVIAFYGVRGIRRPLAATVEQAKAITERRFVTVIEPDVPELRNVTRAMNAMVTRLKGMFDEQAHQVEFLRRQANCDALTGVHNRTHFMSRLKVMLDSEDGAAGGALVLVRFSDLQALNRRLGRPATDRLLQDAVAAINESASRVQSGEVGRLNGSDFALLLPDIGSLREPAVDVAARLRNLLRVHSPAVHAVVGAVRWWHDAPMSALLAAADQALARAEAKGPYSVELDDTGDGLALGEDAWRRRIESALAARRVQLVSFPVVDRSGALLHNECPLRLQLDDDGPLVAAAQWLPMARRTQLTARVDLAAVELALAGIASDGIARAVNLSPASLVDNDFLPRLRSVLAEAGSVAPGLWLEVAESGALRHFGLVRELARQVHVYGTRVGLEHAGERLSEVATLLESGLDFVKLDASLLQGLAHETARAQHVASTVRMLHGIGVKVYAEGVADAADAVTLWDCQIDGLTGPVVVR